jgi:hypothetical protein
MFKKKTINFLFFALLLFSSVRASEIVESVVASLNDRAITYSEIVQEGELINIENDVPPLTPLTPDIKEKILNLIMFRIILFEEAREVNVTVEDKKVREKVKTYMSNVYMKKFLNKYSISELEFTTMIKMRLLADKMTARFLKKRFKNKTPNDEQKKKAVEDWQKNLLKKQKLVLYSIP